jgi:hypothetical protein
MKFALGRLVATPGALEVLRAAGWDVYVLVQRHQTGDWGDLGREDKRANDSAIAVGGRILSAYMVGGVKVYVITEANRAHTTMLRADEY